MPKSEKEKWEDFTHTMRVLTASALARYDEGAERNQQELRNADSRRPTPAKRRSSASRYEIMLLAAADTKVPRLPKSKVTSKNGGLTVLFREGPGEITAILQLQGFLEIRKNAGLEGRLVSTNGAIDYRFRFGRDGKAECVLDNSSAVRLGLAHLIVHVEASET